MIVRHTVNLLSGDRVEQTSVSTFEAEAGKSM